MINTAVFTQWSAPHSANKRHSSLDVTGLALWVLSVNQASKKFEKTILFTDAPGAALLVDRLELPFTEVRVVLDNFVDSAFHHIWCLGKIHAYQQMTEPFLHMDHDVVLWKRLPDRIYNAPICAQSVESLAFGHWRRRWYDLQRMYDIPVKPEWVKSAIARPDDAAVNMGIYGGHDLEFIHRAAQEGMVTLNDPANRKYFAKQDGTVMSVFLEQYWTMCLSRCMYRPIEFLISEDREIANIQCNKLGYSHYWGERKKTEGGRRLIHKYCTTYHAKQFAICEKIAEE